MIEKSNITQINPYDYSKLINPNNISKNINEKNKSSKIKSLFLKRQVSRIKSALLFESSRELKKLTISDKSYRQFMKANENYSKLKDSYFTSRQKSEYILKEDDKGTKKQKITKKSLPYVFYKKTKTKGDINFFRKSNYQSSRDLKTYDLKRKENNFFNNIYDSNINYNEEENNSIKETEYGFKYKDTRIIINKDKLKKIKSALVDNDNAEYDNIKEIKRRKSFEEKSRKNSKNNFNSKKEEEKNETFKFFFEGDFLQSKKNLKKNKKQKEVILKNEEAIDYLNELYTICKKMEKFNARDVTRKMKFNIKRYCNQKDFSFELNLRSICLKFKRQNNMNEEKKIKSQKLFLPFTYLLFFYLLDFETFKIFLSEILIYNEKNDEIEINQKEIRNLLIKYKNYIQVNLGPYFNDKNKNKNKVEESLEKLTKITYNCNERNFVKIYDWIIHINSNNENKNDSDILVNKNIIYKMQIILPLVKFSLFSPKIQIKKYIHKNIIIKLLKEGLAKWEEKILCDLFFNKKFRYLMNSLLCQNKTDFHSKNGKKYFLDKIDNEVNMINKTKYEFFITNAKKEYTYYLYISSYEIFFFYGREEDKFFYKKHINFKDSINLNKFSTYWGYINTVMKCLHVDKYLKKINCDFKILENSPTKFFRLKSGTDLKFDDLEKNNNDNLKTFHNQGYMWCHREDLLIDMFLINFSIVHPCIIRVNFDRYYNKIPKELLNIITKNINSFQKMNSHISEFSEHILSNKELLNINYEDFKNQVFHLNTGKKYPERLKTFTMGVINKSSTFNQRLSSNKISKFKKGDSGGFSSLLEKSMLNYGNNYQKMNTKKFGGSISINMKKINEMNSFHSKKDISRISIMKKISSKKVEHKVERKGTSDSNPINLIFSQEDSIKEENITKTQSYRNKKKKSLFDKKKVFDKTEIFKEYINNAIKKKATT